MDPQKKPAEMKPETKEVKEAKKEQNLLEDPDWLEYRAIREEERRNEWCRNSF